MTFIRSLARRIGLGALLVTTGATAVHAQTTAPLVPSPITLRIGYLRGTTDLTLAKAKGSLEKALGPRNVNIEWAGPFPAAVPAVEALNADVVDITSGSSTSFISSIASNAPLVFFGYQKMTANNEGILVKKDSPIKTLADLQGKRVAVNRGGTGEYLLVRGLEQNKVPVANVTRQYIPPADAGAAFAADAVDAWAVWDPFLSIGIETYGARVLASGTQIGSENAIGYFSSRKFADKYPQVLQAVLEVLAQENRWTVDHAAEAGDILAAELKLPKTLAPRLGRNNVSPLRALNGDDISKIKNIAKWYLDNKVIPTLPNVDAHVIQLK